MESQELSTTDGETTFENEFGEKELKQLRIMSEHGVRQESMAAILGVSRSTLQRMIKHREAVREAVEYGGARGEVKVAKTAFELAESGEHPWFTKFWLQTKAGWKDDTQRIEITGKGGGPIQIENMTPEERAARINDLMKLREKLGLSKDVTPKEDPNGEQDGEPREPQEKTPTSQE